MDNNQDRLNKTSHCVYIYSGNYSIIIAIVLPVDVVWAGTARSTFVHKARPCTCRSIAISMYSLCIYSIDIQCSL